jgi:hypothetical protein
MASSFRISNITNTSRSNLPNSSSGQRVPSKFWTSDWLELLLKHIAINRLGPTHTSRWVFLFANVVYNSYQFVLRTKSPIDSQYWTSKQKGVLNQNLESWVESSCQYFVPLLITEYMKKNIDNDMLSNLINKHKPLQQINRASFNLLKQTINTYLLNRDNDGWKNTSIFNGNLPNDSNVIHADNTVDENLNLLPNIDKWTPLSLGGGVKNYLTPEWGTVNSGLISENDTKDILEKTNDLYPSDLAYEKEMKDVIEITKNLNDEQKVTAEFWAGGPGTVTPPGMWVVFLDIYMRSNYMTFSEEIKNYVLLTSGIYQAGIYAWKLKREHLQARPIQKIRQYLYDDENDLKQEWNSRNQGRYWLPYQELNFVTPPFPDFVSGHSAFSSTSAKLFCYMFGTDIIDLTNPTINNDIINYLSPVLENKDNFTMNNIFIFANSSTVKNTFPISPIHLNWSSWTDMANSSGKSRIYGGIHCESSNQGGLFLGNKIADKIWTLLKGI